MEKENIGVENVFEDALLYSSRSQATPVLKHQVNIACENDAAWYKRLRIRFRPRRKTRQFVDHSMRVSEKGK